MTSPGLSAVAALRGAILGESIENGENQFMGEIRLRSNSMKIVEIGMLGLSTQAVFHNEVVLLLDTSDVNYSFQQPFHKSKWGANPIHNVQLQST
jgi:hypothetical protein